MVEQDRRTASMISTNARQLGFNKADVVAAAVSGTLARTPSAPYDVVFLDPPYAHPDDEVAADLTALRDQEWLVPGAMVVVERGSRGPEPAWPEGFIGGREKKYGETVLWYVHAAQN
jgi:16S rRNA (guanine966-N2)-methyltransferase